MDTATISILVVIIGCIFGLAEWVRNMKKDTGELAAQIRTMQMQISYLEDQVAELKNDKKVIEASIQEIIEQTIITKK